MPTRLQCQYQHADVMLTILAYQERLLLVALHELLDKFKICHHDVVKSQVDN